MEKKVIGLVGCIGIVFVFAFFISSPRVWAKRYKVGEADFYTVGHVKETFQFGMHNPDYSHNPNGANYQLNGPDHGLTMLRQDLYSENQLKWRNWDFRLTLRHELDLADSFHHGGEWDNGSGEAWDRYNDVEDIDADVKANDIIREANIGYFSPYFSFRAGKQQLGWGQADGIRIMDRVEGLDMRKSLVLRDSDEGYSETRIPLWMLKMDFTPPYLFGNSLGFNALDLEVSWIPDKDCHNRFAIGPRQGGPWGFPLPDLPVPLKQLNLPKDYPALNFANSSYAVRLKGTFFGTFFTVNYYYGWSKDFVFDKKDGSTVYMINDPSFRGNVADGAGVGLTLVKYQYRQQYFGFTLSRELPNSFMPVARALGQYTLPVIRVEALYDKDVKFNYGAYTAEGLKKLNSDWIWNAHHKNRDVIRYLIGLDWNLHCRAINPEDNIFLSVQFSQNRMLGHTHVDEKTRSHLGIPGGDVQQLMYAPYNWAVEKNEYFTTLLLNTQYFHHTLRPQVLWVHDWTYHSFWVKPKICYTPGDHWRFEVGAFIIQGKKEKEFGLFRDNDSIYTSIAYQF